MRAFAARTATRDTAPAPLRTIESGDGLIVPVRPPLGTLAIPHLIAIANAADRYGNEEIDLTRSAGLGIRGLAAGDLGAVAAVLGDLGLGDAPTETEAARSVLVNPLAGRDPSALIDVRPAAQALAGRLAGDVRLHALPPGFAFILDDGGALPLDAERADLRLRALDGASFALGLERPAGVHWLGRVAADRAAAAAAEAAARYAASFGETPAPRLLDAPEEAVAAIAAALALAPLPEPPPPRPPRHPLGLVELGCNGVAAALGVPFGRLVAGTARAIARAAMAGGADTVCLSPWRTLYVPLASRDMARAVLASAARYHLLTRDGDPIFRIDACPGAPGCRRAAMATRSVAYRLAPLLPELGIASAHVSGCPLGCARAAPADLVIVGGEKELGLIRDGCAGDRAQAFAPQKMLDDLPLRLRELFRE